MRHDPAIASIVIMLRELKMHGMAQAVSELTEQGSPAFEAAIPILSQLLKAETAEREVRSVAYQLKAARFPAYRDLNGFDFASSEVNEALVRQLHRCEFIEQAHNAVFLGGPGTGNRIVGVISLDPAESLVHIVEMKNGWGRIDKAEGHESGKTFNTKGWVSLRMVAIATRGYDGKGVPAWAAPGSAARSAGRFPSESEVELKNCRGDWPLVRDRSGREAWLRPEDACATALTYCN